MDARIVKCLALFLTCSLALSACAQENVTVDDHVDAVPYLVAEPEMRLGDVDDPDVGFSRVGGVEVDRDGNLYVMEASIPEIRVFAPDGALIRTFGRRGEGPGDFQVTPRFGVVGDTVWAVSIYPDRITLFDRRGNLLSARRAESVAVPLPTGYGYVSPWRMRSDGVFTSHFASVRFPRDSPPTGVGPTDSIPFPFVLFDAMGAVRDTIGWAPRPPPRMWSPPSDADPDFDFVEAGGRRLIVPRPPLTIPWWESLPDGYVLVDAPPAQTAANGLFTVTRFGLAGDTVYHRALQYRPVPYSGADLDSIAARAARGEPGGGVPYSPNASAPPDWEAIAPTLRAAMSFPEFKLPVESVWLAQDESIWLRLSQADQAVDVWLILDDSGHPRGKLELPSRTRIFWARDDTFWAVETDELGIPWVVRYTTFVDPG